VQVLCRPEGRSCVACACWRAGLALLAASLPRALPGRRCRNAGAACGCAGGGTPCLPLFRASASAVGGPGEHVHRRRAQTAEQQGQFCHHAFLLGAAAAGGGGLAVQSRFELTRTPASVLCNMLIGRALETGEKRCTAKHGIRVCCQLRSYCSALSVCASKLLPARFATTARSC
jgi:hypothetical protein